MLPTRRVITKTIGQLLLEKGAIKQAQLEEALKIQKEKGGLLGQILAGLGYVTEEQIAQAITVQYGFPYLPLSNYDIDEKATKLAPENVARQYCLIPIDKIGNTVTIAMADPLNTQAIEDIELLTNSSVQIFVSTATDIRQAIDRCYKKQGA
jgi:type IV pilus assembly protein PilB